MIGVNLPDLADRDAACVVRRRHPDQRDVYYLKRLRHAQRFLKSASLWVRHF